MKVSVLGGSGYVGGELLRLVLGHPQLHLIQATSRRLAGQPLGVAHPNLRHIPDALFSTGDELEPVDAAFVALPPQAMTGWQQQVIESARTVVNLGRDLREDAQSGGDARAGRYRVGLPELYRAELEGCTRISVPGCMATAATVALRPLADAGLVDGDVVVDARTGSSGGGAEADAASHHPERQHAFRVYKATGHRHETEIARMAGVHARMTVTAVPAVRGVQVVCYVRPPEPVTRTAVWDAYRARYAGEPFVRLVARRGGLHRLPDPQFLAGSNFVDVGFDVDADGDRIVAVAALDNLVKGAAGAGVQSLNVAAGMPERSGLEFPGLHPA